MKTLMQLALVLLPVSTWVGDAGAEEPPLEEPMTFVDMIVHEGSCSFSDGSSIYTFRADHVFSLEPTGISGRTIEGVWADVDGKLLVTGQWGWINGMSAIDDFREMLIYVNYHGEEATEVGHQKARVFPVYFTIERLAEIDKETYQKRLEAVKKK